LNTAHPTQVNEIEAVHHRQLTMTVRGHNVGAATRARRHG
jgi:hypothetical protein